MYAVSAALVWALAGLLLNVYHLRLPALALLAIYCAYYGLTESTGLPGRPPPGSSWQVPQSFVIGTSRPRRILTWGGILGPGFFTRNPYAGFWLLPLGISLLNSVQAGVLAAAAIGFAHGSGRALALIRDARGADAASYLQSVLKLMYWRTFDGIMLLALGSMALVIYAHSF